MVDQKDGWSMELVPRGGGVEDVHTTLPPPHVGTGRNRPFQQAHAGRIRVPTLDTTPPDRTRA
jgi:hypothetical protein